MHFLLFGIGLALQNPSAMDTGRWEGEHLQDKSLMDVRDEIQ